jgi:hypothetical protein
VTARSHLTRPGCDDGHVRPPGSGHADVCVAFRVECKRMCPTLQREKPRIAGFLRIEERHVTSQLTRFKRRILVGLSRHKRRICNTSEIEMSPALVGQA